MLYYLYEYLTAHGFHVPGMNLFKYISFRAAMAVLFSLIIAMAYGKRLSITSEKDKWENW